ncbi:hypothetical protein NP493_892g01013 [Ridgeia piscesae]|uniref:Uncharacterized protein n=1 Tax=Ridgeia piscesae TaxID=27915 RepID=A0AAD9KKD6_RIDPI|nr:hypothetical protein NP493_892g01013 [Ridgeia piscesae]
MLCVLIVLTFLVHPRNVEQKVRERFGLSVKRRVTALSLRKATSSPVSTLINNDVLKVYSNSPGMRLHVNNTPHLVEAAKALNVLYVCSNTYESYLIYWLYPLQLAFPSDSGQGEHVYELAMYLDLLNKTCFPSWEQIFAIAVRVMSRLAELDIELHRHLTRIAQIEALVDSNEFLVHLLQQEKAKSEARLTNSPRARTPQKMSKEILADPLVFIRRWIGEGFVSVLDTQATIFIWDQFFLHRWRDLSVIEDLCLTLLLLLKSPFMHATNYTQMKWVFLGEPCLLYTSDIQRAWQGIQWNAGEVPDMNRRRSIVPDVDDRTSPAPEVSTSVAVPQGLDAPFDLYVDAVTNIPDSATVTKVRPGAIAEQSLIKATLFF